MSQVPSGPQVDFTHPVYKKNLPLWEKCRDVIEGEEAVKQEAGKYLPRLEDQTDPEYDSYKNRAMFYGAADRTVKGLTGAVMRKDPSITFPESEIDLLKKIGTSGQSLDQLAKEVLREVIGIGRVGLLVDSPAEENLPPYVAVYFAENIINWRVMKREGRFVLSFLVLKEMAETVKDDGFRVEPETRYRVLRLTSVPVSEESTEVSTVYTVQLYRRNEKVQGGKTVVEFELIETRVPRMNGGRSLDYIPFTFINPTTISHEVEKSPILDLVNVNLSHYRTSADLEHGRHFTALPTAWVAGFDPKTTNLRIGSSVAWVSQDVQAQAGFLEFTGAGLGSLQEALKEKQHLMAVLGARLLEEEPKGVEAAETVKMRHSGEQSSLSGVARSVSGGLTAILRWVRTWTTASTREEDVTIELNQDYNVIGIDPTMVTTLMQALQMGLLSWDTWFYNLKRGEIYPDDRTLEDELELIKMTPVQPPVPEGETETEEAEETETETEETESEEAA